MPRKKLPPEKFFGGKANTNGFKKGVVTNPNGRPPAVRCIADILRRIGEDPAPESILKTLSAINPKLQIEGMNNRNAMLTRTYYDAELGNNDARHFVAERTEGKIRDYIDITSNNEKIGSSTSQIDLGALSPDRILTLREIMRDALRRKREKDASANTSASTAS